MAAAAVTAAAAAARVVKVQQRCLLRRITVPMPARSVSGLAAACAVPAGSTVTGVAGVMYAEQSNVPSLPVPELRGTLARYLRSLAPLVSAKELAEVSALAAAWERDGSGLTLQAALQSAARGSRNWLEAAWDGGVYLKPRMPLPINYNYFLRLADEPWMAGAAGELPMEAGVSYLALARAARLLHGMAAFAAAAAEERLPPDRENGVAVCMNQHSRLLGHARIPARGEDKLVCARAAPTGFPSPHYATTFTGTPARHVVVIARGRFYTADVADESGAPLPVATIAHRLGAIAAAAAVGGVGSHPLGALTAGDRDAWADARAELAAAAPVNAASLAAIDSAMWVVALDDHAPPPPPSLRRHAVVPPSATTAASAALTAESPRFLYGRGDGADRWFDKHQLVVCASGGAGFLMEHAPGDGLTAVRLLNYMQATSCGAPPDTGVAAVLDGLRSGGAGVAPLAWVVPARVARAARAAQAEFVRTTAALGTSVLHTAGFGAAAIKAMRLPPDAYVQMAFQLAHHRLYGFPAPPTSPPPRVGLRRAARRRHGRCRWSRRRL